MMSPCAYCHEDIDKELMDEWNARSPDYPTYFEFACPKCGKDILVDVIPIPTFETTKKSSYERHE